MDEETKKFLERLRQLPTKEAEAILDFATRKVREGWDSSLDNIGQPFDETRKRIKKIEEKVKHKLAPRSRLLKGKPQKRSKK